MNLMLDDFQCLFKEMEKKHTLIMHPVRQNVYLSEMKRKYDQGEFLIILPVLTPKSKA